MDAATKIRWRSILPCLTEAVPGGLPEVGQIEADDLLTYIREMGQELEHLAGTPTAARGKSAVSDALLGMRDKLNVLDDRLALAEIGSETQQLFVAVS